jgi:hypothetical protein
MEPAMSNDHFGFDPSAWRLLTPAQQGAQIRLLAQREHHARSRAIGKAVLEMARALRGAWLRALFPRSAGVGRNSRRAEDF